VSRATLVVAMAAVALGVWAVAVSWEQASGTAARPWSWAYALRALGWR
jgi:hypothetical protein